MEVADLKRLHAAFVHPQQTAIQVKHLDAILAASDEAALELGGIPQRRSRFFSGTVFRERHVQSRQTAVNGIARTMLGLDRAKG
jgi:hypothetical protein